MAAHPMDEEGIDQGHDRAVILLADPGADADGHKGRQGAGNGRRHAGNVAHGFHGHGVIIAEEDAAAEEGAEQVKAQGPERRMAGIGERHHQKH